MDGTRIPQIQLGVGQLEGEEKMEGGYKRRGGTTKGGLEK